VDLTDIDLMERARRGSEDAFDQLVGRYRGALVNYFEKRMGRNEMASELAQEVFVKLWLARERYAPYAPFSSYLFRIAENLYRDEARRARRAPMTLFSHSTVDGDDTELLNFPDPSPSPEEQLVGNSLAESLHQAISELPERAQRVFFLAQVEGKKYHQIAVELRMPLGTVKYRMWQAHEHLKRALQGFADDDTDPSDH